MIGNVEVEEKEGKEWADELGAIFQKTSINDRQELKNYSIKFVKNLLKHINKYKKKEMVKEIRKMDVIIAYYIII